MSVAKTVYTLLIIHFIFSEAKFNNKLTFLTVSFVPIFTLKSVIYPDKLVLSK